MKISHRLVALSGFSAAGLLCVAAVSYFAVTSIQSDLQSLTLRATPLQTKTYEMQERTERLLGSLLRLSLVRTKDDADKTTALIGANVQALDRLKDEIRKLDPRQLRDLGDFDRAQGEIIQAVGQRLADDAAYRSETESARAALGKAEEAVTLTRAGVEKMGVEAGEAADKAQEASRRLANAMKTAFSAQAKLKEIAILVNETDLVTSRFRLSPLKEKLKAATDGLARLNTDGDAALREATALSAPMWDAFTKDATGLFALRAAVLASKPDAETAYHAQRKAILGQLDEQALKLSAKVDSTEAQAFKQSQTLAAALKVRNEPGGVVVVSEQVSLDIREMVGALRLLMLAADAKEAAESQDGLDKLGQRLRANMGSMRAGLLKMGRPALAGHVDLALGAMDTVGASISKVASAKRSLLASEAQMSASLARLKNVAAQQASAGADQIKSIASRQADITAAVDRRVEASLLWIVGIAGGIIAATVALSVLTVRLVRRRLDQAVHVAEAVSRGELKASPEETDNDETARLLRALGSMVATLTGIVGNIRTAAEEINTSADHIALGNRDLSERTDEQAGRLRQTTATVEQLHESIRQNADSATQATALAALASEVAHEGGKVVDDVVQTMGDIQASSRQITEIVGVIDAIAFQTNILALNAAVEAARAGEQGRGFAIVAQEVRSLAMRSAEAAQQIKRIADSSVTKIDRGSALAQGAGQTMTQIVQQVHAVADLIERIAQASGRQSSAVGEVSAAVRGIDEMTQYNSALAEQSNESASSLNQQALSLTSALAAFRIERRPLVHALDYKQALQSS